MRDGGSSLIVITTIAIISAKETLQLLITIIPSSPLMDE